MSEQNWGPTPGVKTNTLGPGEDSFPQTPHLPYIGGHYTKSPEGVEQFRKVGAGYPDTFVDKDYDKFLQQTRLLS